jgi:hypothetical protein
VVYEKAFAAEAEALVEKLKGYGVTAISAVGDDLLSDEDRADNNLIIIALPDNRLIRELNDVQKKLGFFINISQNGFTVLDAEGNASGQFGDSCGLIQATQNPWHPKGIGTGENAVWMITGKDTDGVRSAAEVLLKHPDEIKYAFSVVISEGKVYKVP